MVEYLFHDVIWNLVVKKQSSALFETSCYLNIVKLTEMELSSSQKRRERHIVHVDWKQKRVWEQQKLFLIAQENNTNSSLVEIDIDEIDEKWVWMDIWIPTSRKDTSGKLDKNHLLAAPFRNHSIVSYDRHDPW